MYSNAHAGHSMQCICAVHLWLQAIVSVDKAQCSWLSPSRRCSLFHAWGALAWEWNATACICHLAHHPNARHLLMLFRRVQTRESASAMQHISRLTSPICCLRCCPPTVPPTLWRSRPSSSSKSLPNFCRQARERGRQIGRTDGQRGECGQCRTAADARRCGARSKCRDGCELTEGRR
jgi:hypothetical protein